METLPSAMETNSASNKSEFPVNLAQQQSKSHISSGHCLVKLVHQERFLLYSEEEYRAKAIYISADYWLHHFLSALRLKFNRTVAERINATIVRARHNTNLYEVTKPSVTEFITEALFDNQWFRAKETDLSRVTLRNHIKSVLDKNQSIHLYLPIFSRKPFSPIKNRGHYPDLAEIQTLVRCAEVAQIISAFCPTGCRLTILADGFKYNRACLTPDSFINDYQSSLYFWVDRLNIGDNIQVVNYEQWLEDNLSSALLQERKQLYETYCDTLSEQYNPLFNPANIDNSLGAIEQMSDVGEQLCFTFKSIVTSTYYSDLFSLINQQDFSKKYYGNEIQQLYIAYILSLDQPLTGSKLSPLYLPTLGCFSATSCSDLFYTMRQQAWGATLRYVAISLADRDLSLLKTIDDDAVKLTIHSKKGEIKFLSSRDDVTITAQHSTGGVSLSKGKYNVGFRYRIERESQGEHPILIEPLPDTEYFHKQYGWLHNLQKIGQPIGYTSNIDLFRCGR